MWYLLVFYTLSGEMVDEELWSRNHRYFTMEQCTAKKVHHQRLVDRAWMKDGGNKKYQMSFECLLGPETLAKL
jgi:hypothetical protein